MEGAGQHQPPAAAGAVTRTSRFRQRGSLIRQQRSRHVPPASTSLTAAGHTNQREHNELLTRHRLKRLRKVKSYMCSLTLQVSEKGNFCIRGNVPFMPSLPSSPELRSASRHRSSHRWSRAGFKGWRRASQPAAEQVDVAPPKPAIPQCWPVLLSLSTRLTRQSYEWRKGDTDGPFSVPALNPFAALSEGVRLTRLGDDTERLHGSTCKCHMMIPVSDAADDSCHDCRREGRSVGWERPGKQGKLLPGHCPWH